MVENEDLFNSYLKAKGKNKSEKVYLRRKLVFNLKSDYNLTLT